MKREARGEEFRLSQVIYERLLLAYPPRHRAEYGAAMAQLFRDQCRDAWDESRNWGLLKLWLRTLPDLASTSILERLAALKERKTMSEKLANLSTLGVVPKIVFILVFAAVFLVTLIVGTAVTFILPEAYASTARISVEPEPTKSDPNFIQTTCELIKSPAVLNSVIDKLKLNVTWGKKYFNGETLKSLETMEILKTRLQIAPLRNTKLIAITAYSDDKNEAAQIANAIADSYRDYRMESYNGPKTSPQPAMVQIADPAEPGHAPVRPNKPLNIFISGILGAFFGLAAGTISAFISFKLRNSGRKTAAV